MNTFSDYIVMIIWQPRNLVVRLAARAYIYLFYNNASGST